MITSGPPLVAISPNALPPENRRFYKMKALEYGETSLAYAVRLGGGVPVMAFRAGARTAEELADGALQVIQRCQGLVLSGGQDISPEMYGERLQNEAWRGDVDRDRWELALYRAAIDLGRPVLGVCRGAQLINVAEGGSLYQDLATMRENASEHRCQERYDTLSHDVSIEPDTELHAIFGDEAHHVNSVHHQGLKDVAMALRVVGTAHDGVIEAFERMGPLWVVGVQWHPEWMLERESQRRLFLRFVEEARQVTA